MKYFKECEESEATHEAESCVISENTHEYFKMKEINRWDQCEFEKGQKVYALVADGYVENMRFPLYPTPENRHTQGNIFATRAEAETERHKRAALATIQWYLRATQECKGKWCEGKPQGLVEANNGQLTYGSWDHWRYTYGDLYFDSKGNAKKGLDILRDEYRTLFGVES